MPTDQGIPTADDPADLKGAALWYAEHGFPVFPLHSAPNGRCSCNKDDCAHPGKHPRTRHGFKDATKDRNQILNWWRKWPDANIGMPTGPVSGLMAMDCDPRNGGPADRDDLVQQFGPVPETAEVISGGGGRHLYFFHPGGQLPPTLAQGIDLKGNGGYIIVPPSIHPSGKAYQWDGIAGMEALLRLAAPPSWLIERITAPQNSAGNISTLNGCKKWSRGSRNIQLTSLAGSMRHRGMARESIEVALIEENNWRCEPPLPVSEVRNIARSIARYSVGERQTLEKESTTATPQFRHTPDGMFQVMSKGEQLIQTRLTNFRAQVAANVILDDGVEPKNRFEIDAELKGRLYHFTIPASEFTCMDWVVKHMGPTAIVFPRQKDHARAAIQSLSLDAERRIYTHTGWRNVEGNWCFLHSTGAVSELGALSNINVSLPAVMGHFELELPTDPDALRHAIQASLRVIELAPPGVSFPLRAASCRAVLGNADFSVHVVGETGAFKSELAALEQQHFGRTMTRVNLPGTWSSTANAIEALAFFAKDVLIVVDDFAPQGSINQVASYHAAANRVFRGAGNRAGRGRLDSTARLQESKPPRGLILSTGEDIPEGHSIRARLLILELSRGAVHPNQLSRCQGDAAAGLYAQAMGAFARWLAAHYDETQTFLNKRTAELRLRAVREVVHPRTPEIIANLQAAFEIYLRFCHDVSAISVETQEQLSIRCWDALREAAAAQTKHHLATEPTTRFLELLSSCLACGKAHLADRKNTAPSRNPVACGWRCDRAGHYIPSGECIGWIDGDDIYLDSPNAYRIAQAACVQGQGLLISEQVLKKRLFERDLLVSAERNRETLMIRRTIAGSEKSVLHLRRGSLLPEECDGDDVLEPAQDQRNGINVGFCREESLGGGKKPDRSPSNEINHMSPDRRECRVSTEEGGLGKKLNGDKVIEKPDLSARPVSPKPNDQTPCIERFEL